MIRLIFIGKTKESYVKQGLEDFLKRIARFSRIDVIELPEEKRKGNSNQAKEAEGERIISTKKGSMLVCMDSKGKEMDSEQFSDFMKKNIMQDISFAIGGPDGLSKKVMNNAEHVISLSKMTFNHQIVRLFLIEQIYRACTIQKNIPYHK